MALDCACFRHAREPEEFHFQLHGDHTDDIPGLIIGRGGATNLSDPVEVRLPVRIRFEDRECLPLAETLVGEFVKAQNRRARAFPSSRKEAE